MIVKSIKTDKVVPKKDTELFKILDKSVKNVSEGSILAITSKIVAICEGRVIKIDQANKADLIKQESEYYLPPEQSKYNITLTIKNNLLIPTAGIDESNANGYYILWPQDSQKTANQVRAYLKKRFSLEKIGVIITDSKTTPLRWGVTGATIAHSGFYALNNYIGTPDIFGKELKVTKVNVIDALAASAVLIMGEGKEQTPLATIEDIPFVEFVDQNPSQEEIADLKISLEDDLYASLLTSVQWEKGEGK